MEFKRRFPVPVSELKLACLALILAILWYWPSPGRFTPEEKLLWDRVRTAQHYLVDCRARSGIQSAKELDPWELGLIGVPWSPITTTLGDLGAKRTACNPAWAVQFTRWFARAGLVPGDRVALFSSSSFPGLLVNAVMAAQSMDLDLLLVVSMGASTYGANHPDLPWPVIHRLLVNGGFVRTAVDYYTLGGNDESGRGMMPEGRIVLEAAAAEARAEMLSAGSLAEMIRMKSALVQVFDPKLFINIGGSHANLGTDESVLNLPPGLILETPGGLAGNGVLGFAASRHIPIIHMLNLKPLSLKLGIPFDQAPGPRGFGTPGNLRCLLGVILFFAVLGLCNRWTLKPLR